MSRKCVVLHETEGNATREELLEDANATIKTPKQGTGVQRKIPVIVQLHKHTTTEIQFKIRSLR